MSKPRTIQEINNEYFQTAAMMGDLVHKVIKFTGDNPFQGQINELNMKLNSIDKEADIYQKTEERERKAKITKAGEAGLNGKEKTSTPETVTSEVVQ